MCGVYSLGLGRDIETNRDSASPFVEQCYRQRAQHRAVKDYRILNGVENNPVACAHFCNDANTSSCARLRQSVCLPACVCHMKQRGYVKRFMGGTSAQVRASVFVQIGNVSAEFTSPDFSQFHLPRTH